ncbi:MAG TPA: hypothetical protein VKU82_13490 [Planctomycetaceae bacterium]|nr:hypothetical protein [Planctomycetaceae bacterium]
MRDSPTLAVGFAVIFIAALSPAHGAEWKYIVPEMNGRDAGAVLPLARSLFLSEAKPEDLREDDAPYRGRMRLYAQLRYGGPSSIRVTFVIDELDDGTADLYVDANRNRTIEKRDRINGAAPDWQVPLEAAMPQDDVVDLYRRRVSVHLGASGRTLAVATLGSMQGSVTLGDKTFAARRTDGDANGSFANAGDRLWIDMNSDGEWDAFTEQFEFANILRIAGTRYASRSDVLGDRLTLEPLVGSASIKIVLPESLKSADDATIAVTLVGRDGTAVLASGQNKPTEVPSGEYQMQSVYISFPAKGDSRRWTFSFSADSIRQPPWREVKTGDVLELDPIGSLEMTLQVEGNKRVCAPGETLVVRPRLYTGDGLLINSCYWGAESTDERNHSKCRVTLEETGDEAAAKPVLASGQSGFV